jgi:hypothetical protein
MPATDRSRAAALEALELSFLDQVDPDRKLPEGERLRRAAAVRSEHFRRLARRAVLARTQKRLAALVAADEATER